MAEFRWTGARPCADASADVQTGPEPALGLLLAYLPVPVPSAGHHRLGKSLPISLVALGPLFLGSGGLVAAPVHGGILCAPGIGPKPQSTEEMSIAAW